MRAVHSCNSRCSVLDLDKNKCEEILMYNYCKLIVFTGFSSDLCRHGFVYFAQYQIMFLRLIIVVSVLNDNI